MSRTRNISKYEFDKEYGSYEYPHGLDNDKYNVHIEPGEERITDISGTTRGGDHNPDVWQKLTRHPNKRKKRGSLNREFKNVGMSSPSYWKNRFGEEHDKSSRMRLIKREMTQTRRHRMKHDAEEEIERSLNEHE